MKKIFTPMLVVGALAVAACGGQDNGGETAPAGSGSTATAPVNSMDSMPAMDGGAQTGEVHSGTGDITEVSADSVTISHGPIESANWPAMTMAFKAESAQMVQGLNVGDPVRFEFRQAGAENVLTSISAAQQ